MENLQNTEHLTETEQKAWRDVASKLIFTDEVSLDISEETIKDISHTIQRQFLEIPGLSQRSARDMINKSLSGLLGDMDLPLTQVQKDRSLEETDESRIAKANSLSHVRDMSDYSGTGFTPRLARAENGSGLNCLGRAISLGAELKEMDIAVEMAVSPDHPYLITQSEKRKYLIGYSSEPIDVTDMITKQDDSVVVRLNDPDTEKPKLLIIQDFDRMTVYEILENIAVLANVASGTRQYLLPTGEAEATRVANDHRDILNADWKSIQRKLFPEIEKSFASNEWREEIQRMQKIRDKQYEKRFWIEVFESISKPSDTDTDKQQRADALLQEAGEHGALVFESITNNDPSSIVGISHDLNMFIEHTRQNLLQVPERVRARLVLNLKDNLGLTK